MSGGRGGEIVASRRVPVSMASLQAILAENGLGEYADVFAAEKIDTLEDVADLSSDQLKELGLPMGPRNKIIKLFASKPRPPDGPAPSNPSPRGRSLQTTDDDVTMNWSKRDSGKQFACFLSHHKSSCAMEARFLKVRSRSFPILLLVLSSSLHRACLHIHTRTSSKG